MTDVPTDPISRVEAQFHALILRRAEAQVREYRLILPTLRADLEVDTRTEQAWFPVPGMMGGFAYRWAPGKVGQQLIVESWSRGCGGSGQRHEVDGDGYRLVDEGFV